MSGQAMHGTRNNYSRGCRCDDCTTAAREYARDRRARHKANGYVELTHGLVGTYTSGCRCDECRESRRLYGHTNNRMAAHAAARLAAARWVVENHPDIFAKLRDAAYDELLAAAEATT